MLKNEAEELLDELKQICHQYKAEVPGKHRAWPKSVKDRVLQLRQLEVTYQKIVEVSGISHATLYNWVSEGKKRLPPGELKPLVVVDGRKNRGSRATPTVKAPTVTVIASNGYRIEGLEFSKILELMNQ